MINYNFEFCQVYEYSHLKIVKPIQSIYFINCDEFHLKLNSICPLSDVKDSNNKSTLFKSVIHFKLLFT
jgi:hypothetical protein